MESFSKLCYPLWLALSDLRMDALSPLGNREESRVRCIVVHGKPGSNAHDQQSPRNGKGEDPAQR